MAFKKDSKSKRDDAISVALDSATEATPLLVSPVAVASGSGTPSAGNGESSEESLPKLQIFLLCYARLVEPIAFFSIFPYINNMVQKNGNLKEEDVGFYAGMIESFFSLTQMVVMMFWGRAADRCGRRPVLVSSLLGVAISVSLFGLAQSIWQMIALRCIAGAFAGTVVTIRTMIAEHSTPRNQAHAFSWFAFAGNVGMFLGPLVGGALEDPAHQYPWAFGGVPFFEKYPYALPSIVAGCIGLSAMAICALFIKETLKSRNTQGANSSGGEAGTTTKPAPPSTLELIKSRGVGMVLYIYGHSMILGYAYTTVIPVFWYTSVKLGGLGFVPSEISFCMGLTGLSQAVWLLFAFPALQRRYGTNGVIRGCGIAYPFFIGAMPFLNLILYQGTPVSHTAFLILLFTLLTIGLGVSMAFTAALLALTDVSPSPETLGTLNAIALTIASGLRSFSPMLFNSLFALSAKYQLLWGYFIWFIVVILASAFTVATRYLPAASEKTHDPPAGQAEDNN
ncbi:MFS general substrate transporter [Daldinia caldariorum]|uniref:MFS general substrate transporter n=1 Tax=Daldinia caldariorum TaxID=326644 RepID=UPI002007B645|nr:MFS general substrate transporter [Daldinia caldariorum]KAI1469635.1 MFS general substrate transporter [Daldinia caldariorum]